MIPSIALSVYLLIGLLYADHEYKKTLSVFEEEYDENNPDDRDLIEMRDRMYDSLHTIHSMVGEKGLKITLYLCDMIFWLPLVIYTQLYLRFK